MDRRLFLTLAAVALATPLASEAQQADRIYRIGWLGLEAQTSDVYKPFRQGLRDLGYVEGQNITIEYLSAEGEEDRLPKLAAELARQKVDIIVAPVTSTTRAAMNVTRTIPIVMLSVPDPVGSGLIQSLARPGGNVTGLSFHSPELSGKQLQLLKEVVREMVRVAVLRDPAGASGHQMTVLEAKVAAVSLGMQLQVVDVRGPDDFEAAFATMAREAAGGLLVPAHATFFRHRTRLAELAARSRIPAIYGATGHATAGGLMTYAASLSDNFRRGALFVDKLLKGAQPADLPVEQPTKFELVINLKTAKALGLTIPPSLLLRAEQVID